MERDWRVDTLRGYFLVAMTLGHFPNPVARFTEYTFGYASAPDGFVFLSGLVSAWVYLRVDQRRGHRAMVSKSLRRAGTIYLTHVALLVFGLFVAFFPMIGPHRTPHPFQTFISGALLWNQVGFDRILPMYCVFMAFNPLVLGQFTKGRAWLVGMISAVLWTGAQFGLGDPRPGLDTYTFNLFAWQAYFVAGQYIGYRAVRSETPGVGKTRTLLAACVVVALPLMLDRHSLFESNPILGFSGHPDHNPVRFLDAACLAYIVWWIPRAVDVAAMKLRFFQFLNLLGRHSLQVFAFSMIFTRFEARTIRMLSPQIQLALAVLTVLSLALPAWFHQYLRQRWTLRQREAFSGIPHNLHVSSSSQRAMT